MKINRKDADRIKAAILANSGSLMAWAAANSLDGAYLSRLLSGKNALSLSKFNRLFGSLGFEVHQPEPVVVAKSYHDQGDYLE